MDGKDRSQFEARTWGAASSTVLGRRSVVSKGCRAEPVEWRAPEPRRVACKHAVPPLLADQVEGNEPEPSLDQPEGRAAGKGKKKGGKGGAEPTGDVRQIGAILAALLSGQ